MKMMKNTMMMMMTVLVMVMVDDSEGQNQKLECFSGGFDAK